jgi:hypothetical protein
MVKRKTKSPPPTSKKWVDVRLNSPDHVRRLLTKLINMTMNNAIKEDRLRAVTYSCQTILKVFELTIIEKKLEKIVQGIDEIRQNNKED